MNYKTEIYDKFSCIGDKCNYNCCGGWNIKVDEKTFEKWREEKEFFSDLKKCTFKGKLNNKDAIFITLNQNNMCVFQDENGLCKIVKKYGTEMLSKICQGFPRTCASACTGTYENLQIKCPEVVNLIYKNYNLDSEKTEIKKLLKSDNELISLIFDKIFNIFTDKNYNINKRFYFIYSFLYDLYTSENNEEQIIENYDAKKISELSLLYDTRITGTSENDYLLKIKELNMILLNLIKYKNSTLAAPQPKLKEIYDFSKTVYKENYFSNYNEDMQNFLNKNRGFLEKVYEYSFIVAMVESHKNTTLRKTITYLIINLEDVILQYCLAAYSIILTYNRNINIDEKDIAAIISYLAREMGEENTFKIIDFLNNIFKSYILDSNYIRLLLN